MAVPKNLIKIGILICFLSLCVMIDLIRNPDDNFSTDIHVPQALGNEEFDKIHPLYQYM